MVEAAKSRLPHVRIAVAEDEPAIMAMCRRLHAEIGLFSLQVDKVRDVIRKCFNRAGVIVGVIGKVGRLEASTCLIISDYYYTDDWHLAELWNFVDAPYRAGTRNAEALINFGKTCAEQMGCPLLTGIITSNQTAGKVRLYRRLLGSPTGAFFIHNAKWSTEPMASHGDLLIRLRELARLCNDFPRQVTSEMARQKIGPMLREAAEVIRSEDQLWGPPGRKRAGAV